MIQTQVSTLQLEQRTCDKVVNVRDLAVMEYTVWIKDAADGCSSMC